MRWRLTVFLFLATIGSLTGCGSSGETAATNNPAIPTTTGNSTLNETNNNDTPTQNNPPATETQPDKKTTDCTPTDFETALLNAHNQARSQSRDCGGEQFPAVAALTWNCTLATASDAHSQDMASVNFFSHTGSNGLSPFDRMTNAGYSFRNAGENIAAGQQTIETVMQGWLNSEGHCKNIMSINFTEMGGSKVDSSASDYRHYWTVKFGRPR